VSKSIEDFPDWRFEFSHGSEVGVIPIPGEPLLDERSIARIKAIKPPHILYATDQDANIAWANIVSMIEDCQAPA
jgi:hypothetical protein